MSKIYNQIPSGKILETSNWEAVDEVKNGVKIMRTLSNLEEEKYHQLKSVGATDSAIWKALRTSKEELESSPLKQGTMQIELTIPLQELTKRQLILLFNKYAGFELQSMLSMRKDDIIKLIHAISPSNITRVKVEDKWLKNLNTGSNSSFFSVSEAVICQFPQRVKPTVRDDVEKYTWIELEPVTTRFQVRALVEEQIQGLFPNKDPDIAIFWVF